MNEEIIRTNDQCDKIKLTRGQKGGYGWEISIPSLDVAKLEMIDHSLREKFLLD